MNDLPEGFVPLVLIGELDNYVMMYTAVSTEETLELLEATLEQVADENSFEHTVQKH